MRNLLVLALLAGAVAGGSGDAEKAKRKEAIQRFAKAQAKNRAHFHGYRWMQREQVFLDRERRAIRTFSMKLTRKGEIQSILTNSAILKPKKPKLRFMETDKQRRQRKELLPWVEAAEKVLRRYIYFPTDKMAAFLARAEVEPGTGSQEGAILAKAGNFLSAGDLVRVWIDPKTLQLRRIDYRTTVRGDAVRGWVAYRTLKDKKAHYPARTELTAPGRKIRLVLENEPPLPPAPNKK